MQIKAHLVIAGSPEVIVSHGTESLNFTASVFTRKAFVHENYDVFDTINAYWARMPYEQQSAIWDIYTRVYRVFEEALSGDELYSFLNASVKELLVHHSLDHLETFLAMDPSVMVPENVLMDYVESRDDNNTRGKTYTHKDYMRLIALSLFMRTLVPIWGHYVASIRKTTGMECKEYFAFQLVIGTGLLETEAMQKLMHYIDQITKEKRGSQEKILNAISSEDMGFMLLALVCIRRLCVADLRGNDPKTQPVSKVYKFLFQKVFNPTERDSFVKTKIYGEQSSGSDQSKRSLLESYRKRTEISIGGIAELEFAYEDVYGIAQRIAPTITKEEVDASLATVQQLRHERIGDAQLILLGWVFKTVISPKAPFYISKECATNALGVAEAVLWHLGHKYLATLVSSHLVIGVEEMSVSQIDVRMQVPEALASEIKMFYPFTWTSVKKKTARQDTADEPHPVLLSIDLMMDELTKNAWRKTASEAKIIEVYGRFERKLKLRPETKSDLARLLIDLERRRTVSSTIQPI